MSEFKAGDLVTLSQYSGDFAKENYRLYEIVKFINTLETFALLKDQENNEVSSGIEHLQHATPEEIKAGRRLNEK